MNKNDIREFIYDLIKWDSNNNSKANILNYITKIESCYLAYNNEKDPIDRIKCIFLVSNDPTLTVIMYVREKADLAIIPYTNNENSLIEFMNSMLYGYMKNFKLDLIFNKQEFNNYICKFLDIL